MPKSTACKNKFCFKTQFIVFEVGAAPSHRELQIVSVLSLNHIGHFTVGFTEGKHIETMH